MPIRWRAGRAIGVLLLTISVTAAHLVLPLLLPGRPWVLARPTAARAPALETRQLPALPAPVAEAVTPSTSPQQPDPAPPPPQPKTARAPVTERPASAPSAAASAAPGTTPALTASATEPTEVARSEGALLYAVSGRLGGQPLGGSARLEWKLGSARYTLSLQATGTHRYSVVFAWNLKTEGRIAAEGLVPQRYEEDTQFSGASTSHRVLQSDAREPDRPQAEGLDPLSALLRLAADVQAPAVATAASEPRRTAISVRLPDRPVTLDFEGQGEETLESPFGPLRTEKYVTRHAAPIHDDPIVTVWMAPELQHTPVRIRLERQDLATVVFDLASEPQKLPAWR